MTTADVLECVEEHVGLDADPLVHGQQEVLGRQVFVGQVLTGDVGVGKDPLELLAHLGGVAAVGTGELGQPLLDLVAQRQGRDPDPLQHRQHDALGLSEQGRQHMVGRELGVTAGGRQVHGGLDRLAGLVGPLLRVDCHVRVSLLRENCSSITRTGARVPRRQLPDGDLTEQHRKLAPIPLRS